MIVPLMLATLAAPSSPERSFATAPFHAVRLATRASVELSPAAALSVRASGAPNVLPCVTARVEDGVLILWDRDARSQPDAARAGEVLVVARRACRRPGGSNQLHIAVTAPAPDAVILTDSGTISVHSVRAPSFSASIPGHGAIMLDRLMSQATEMSIGGSGSIIATGGLGRLRANIGGGGTIDAGAASATALDVNLAGHGGITARTSGPATGTLAGNGSVTVLGQPTCAIRKAGKGKVVCPG